MKIGNITLEKTACLAPMAGVADRAFREICKQFGACYLVGELASSKGLTYQGSKTQELLLVTEEERPMAVQLFGDDPLTMARAAELCLPFRPDVIDINMGCPAPKVVGGGGGSALMKDPKRAGEILREVKRAVPVPVTAKFRKGWDEQSVNAVEFAKVLEQSGADALCIHGRTRRQMYAPPVDWEIIKRVKEAVGCPVIGNGGVDSIDSCIAMYETTGCDLVMIGQGALGRPWLFGQIQAYFATGERLPEPTFPERMQVMLRHMQLLCQYKGEEHGMREARKHVAWYVKGLPGAASYRRRAGELKTYAQLRAMAQEMTERFGPAGIDK